MQVKYGNLLELIDDLKAKVKQKEAEIIEKSLENQRLSAYSASLRQVNPT